MSAVNIPVSYAFVEDWAPVVWSTALHLTAVPLVPRYPTLRSEPAQLEAEVDHFLS